MFDSKESKKAFVRRMFDDISDRYDFLNRVISFGLDGYCRRKGIRRHIENRVVLDICSGTADMSIELLKQEKFGGIIVLGDFSMRMQVLAGQKMAVFGQGEYESRVYRVCCDAENMPFKEGVFDGIISGYSLRNLGDLRAFGLEMERVMRFDGNGSLIDVAHPPNGLFARLFYYYFYKLIPLISRLFTRKKYAYKYLPVSLRTFFKQPEVVERLCSGKLTGEYENLLGGSVALYKLKKNG
jgi:demethylmenaquinone methyltransferase / 2-methoxy-6-polyprenyl-1,4-benzoquinol methylase